MENEEAAEVEDATGDAANNFEWANLFKSALVDNVPGQMPTILWRFFLESQ